MLDGRNETTRDQNAALFELQVSFRFTSMQDCASLSRSEVFRATSITSRVPACLVPDHQIQGPQGTELSSPFKNFTFYLKYLRQR